MKSTVVDHLDWALRNGLKILSWKFDRRSAEIKDFTIELRGDYAVTISIPLSLPESDLLELFLEAQQ